MTAAQVDQLAPYEDELLREIARVASRVSHHELVRYQLGLEVAGFAGAGTRTPLRGGCVCLAVADGLGVRRAQAMPVAVAVELLHSVALIAADLHLDRDERNDRAALARVRGVALTLNTLDGMFSLAQVVLARLPEAGVAPEVAAACLRRFDASCLAACEGLPAYGTAPELTLDYAAAFGAPLAAGVASTALIAGADERCVDALASYGGALGALNALPSESSGFAVNAPDLAAAAVASLDGSGLDDASRSRLAAIARYLAGGAA